MNAHARLSPSASERWLECPASVLDIEALPPAAIDPTSVYAQEGTICHELAEIRGRAHFGHITKAEAKKLVARWRKNNGVDLHTENEMWGHVDTWLEILQGLYDEHPGSVIHFEQRLDTGVPSSFGTTDAAIVSPYHINVVDFKYGAGVRVDAEDNSQLRLYGLGILDEYDVVGTVKDISLTVVQPRIDEGHVSTEKLTVEQLLAWRDKILPIAEAALLPGAPYGPSEKSCRWCPLSGKCRAQLESIFEAEVDFEEDPATLSPEETADLLAVIPRMKNWIAAFEATALHRAQDGEPIPGWKVVMSGGRRGCNNEEAVLAALKEEGHSLDDVTTRKLVGIGVLEALLGKKEFAQKLGMWFPKSSGRPSLVPDDDNRPAIDRNAEAAVVFKEIDD